ncbi:hypothetical protein ADL00_26690 [Streptomyces sp. AS58]|nr:hypothetical protein ADL00_26690 [Streptomyces sp. AS58]
MVMQARHTKSCAAPGHESFRGDGRVVELQCDDLMTRHIERTTGTTSSDHFRLLAWAKEWDGDQLSAVEGCG